MEVALGVGQAAECCVQLVGAGSAHWHCHSWDTRDRAAVTVTQEV